MPGSASAGYSPQVILENNACAELARLTVQIDFESWI
jgi:hypothetical protein